LEKLDIFGEVKQLRLALERGEFELHYQPKLSCATGRISGAEALLRWFHPTRGTVSPADFVPLLEQSELIAEVGAWIIQTACAQVRTWHDAGFTEVSVAVNLTGRQLLEPALLEQVGAALDSFGLPPGALELEVTESLLMASPAEAGARMGALRALGVRLSIDDFGTGYSSLNHLKRLPVNSLKIDRSFINDIVEDPNDVSITRAIIHLAHQLRLQVSAVGVETESQLGLLIANGCDEIQGYFFSPAVPGAEITAMLQAGRGLPPEMLRSSRGGRTLLLVDDEENIVAALRRLLRRSGYRILTAGNGPEGLEVLAREQVDVIVSDQRMPGMTGVEFLRRVKAIHPDTVRVVLSGYTELRSITDAINEGAIYKFLTKPWDEALLLANIDEAFQHKDMIDHAHRLDAQLMASNSELARLNSRLESVLATQREHIERSEVALALIREGLELIPLPILGVDATGFVAFGNAAAASLFGGSGAVLGARIEELLGHDGARPERFVAANGARYRLDRRAMGGSSASSAGELFVFMPLAS
jgi:EAL domain-containing protein (putative c-di-GMP-specific phosphodiesterase class I)/FixJ family two-component response regulator